MFARMKNSCKRFLIDLKKELKEISVPKKKDIYMQFKIVLIGVILLISVILTSEMLGNFGIEELLKLKEMIIKK